MDYRPWPEGLPGVAVLMDGAARGQLIFQNGAEQDYHLLLGNKPGTFLYHEQEVKYYIITRPLLPHELPEDFSDYE